jgi:cytoskeleton protein RodZ
MSAHSTSGQEDHAVLESPGGPGRRLRVARQAQGLDLGQVADELHLREPMIESLERDDYEALPSRVFVIGYIRKYACRVGLDPEPLVAAYRAAVPEAEPTSDRSALPPARQIGSGHLAIRLISVGILILVASLTYLWWKDQHSGADVEAADSGAEREIEPAAAAEAIPGPHVTPFGDRDSISASEVPQLPALELDAASPEPDAAAVPAVGEELRPTAAAGRPRAEEEADEEGWIGAEDAGTATTERESEEPVAAEQEDEQTAAPSREIVMDFDGPCWVDIRDSEGKVKLFGEMKKGDHQVLDGEPPYSVILGNAAAVTIRVGGAELDLSSRSRGNVARFTLDPDEMP